MVLKLVGHSTRDLMLNWGSGPQASVGVSSDAVGANGFAYIGHRANNTIIRLRTGVLIVLAVWLFCVVMFNCHFMCQVIIRVFLSNLCLRGILPGTFGRFMFPLQFSPCYQFFQGCQSFKM